jgi:hypothetical protein
MRQRPFGIAGDRHGLALLVRAPHRLLRCMGNLLCMGLILRFLSIPSPRGLHSAHHRLAAGMHMDVRTKLEHCSTLVDRAMILQYLTLAREQVAKCEPDVLLTARRCR